MGIGKKMQSVIAVVVTARGDSPGGHFLANKKAPGGAIVPMSTGRYDYYCTGVLFAAGGVVISCG